MMNEMKKKEISKIKNMELVLVFALGTVLFMNAVGCLAASAPTTVVGGSYLKITFMNQDPYPAQPGSYVNLLFKVENYGSVKAENVSFELMPTYPFSLDPDVSPVQSLGTVNPLENGDTLYYVKYRLKMDENAVDGENDLKIKCTYNSGTSGTFESIKTANVTVEDERTDFDVIVQDTTSGTTTLAIANTGANTAYAVIIKIPEQSSYIASGISATIIGNLDAGDYTLASFEIVSVRNNATRGNNENLIVEVAYTDGSGIRRTVQKEVSFGTNTNISSVAGQTGAMPTGAESFQGFNRQQSSSNSNSIFIYSGIVIAGIIIGVVVYLKIIKRKKK